jgi:hypothetical protein
MAQAQPFEFSEDTDFAAFSSGGSVHEAELSEAGMSGNPLADAEMDQHGSQHAGEQSRHARQAQSATQTRAMAQQHETTTPLHRKRGNQPR